MPKSFGPLSDNEKLIGRANYHNWSIRLYTILRHKDCYSGVVQLPLEISATDDGILAYCKRQIKAIALIPSTVHDDMLSTISKFDEDPFALWQHLQSMYECRNTQRRLVLIQTFFAVKMQGNDAYEYIRRIDSLVSQLNSIGYRTLEFTSNSKDFPQRGPTLSPTSVESSLATLHPPITTYLGAFIQNNSTRMANNAMRTKNPILCPTFLTAAMKFFVSDNLFSSIVLPRFFAEGIMCQRKQTRSTTPTRKPMPIRHEPFSVITIVEKITSPPPAT